MRWGPRNGTSQRACGTSRKRSINFVTPKIFGAIKRVTQLFCVSRKVPLYATALIGGLGLGASGEITIPMGASLPKGFSFYAVHSCIGSMTAWESSLKAHCHEATISFLVTSSSCR
jgi:hypothetical protein